MSHPKGKWRGKPFPVVHEFNGFGYGISLNHRRIIRVADESGTIKTYRMYVRKSVKFNRLPRGTGVINGQCVADILGLR